MKSELGRTDQGKALNLDVERLVETRLLAVANSGGGKSYLLRKLLEVTHGQVQQVILDVDGEFASLREKLDFILAGKGGDITADPQVAEVLARKVLELRASIIIDLYELKHRDRIRFVRLFLEAMMNAPKELWHPVMVVVDEAHLFCPEKGEAESAEAVIDLATRGRKRGFCAVLATQRLSKLHKDAAAECINKLIGRVGLDIDMKRAGDELGFNSRTQVLSLRDLEPGDFYAFGPALSKEIVRVKIGATITRHAKAGQYGAVKAPMPTDKIKGVLAKLNDLPRQAEQELDERRQLRDQVRGLQQELATARRTVAAPVVKADPQAEQKAFTRGATDMDVRWKKKVKDFRAAQAKAWNEFEEGGPSNVLGFKEAVREAGKFLAGKTPSYGSPQATALQPKTEGGFTPRTQPTKLAPTFFEGGQQFGKCERAILGFLAGRGQAMTKVQVAAITGYAPGGGGFNNSIGSLATAGLVERDGEKLRIKPGAEGQVMDVLGPDFKAPGPEALNDWINRLGKCEREIFRTIKDAFPDLLAKGDVANRTGYGAGGGGFNNAIGRLCTLGLAVRQGGAIGLNPEVGNL